MYKIKQEAEDFIVEEITEQETLSIDKTYFFKESKGKHLICVLKKDNWDTQLALREIAKRLHISKNRIGFAGTKDKKAISIQLISITSIKPEDLERVKIKDIEIYPLYLSDKRLSLGHLKGNQFTIKIYTNEEPKKLKIIPNYFGEQRFGKIRPITHLVGKEIIKENVKQAVLIYLAKSFEGESEETKQARERLGNELDFKEALNYFPNYLKFERMMLTHLAEYPEDYIGALRILPKTLKMMFVHAFQSFLFNKMLDYTIEKNLNINELPLIGYDSDLTDWQMEILENENIKLENLRIKTLPELSSAGLMRLAFIKLNDFEIKEKENDFIIVKFSLPKGTYATTVLEYLFKE